MVSLALLQMNSALDTGLIYEFYVCGVKLSVSRAAGGLGAVGRGHI